MPRDKLTNLNDAIFQEIETLQDNDLTDEQFEKEVKRAKLISDLSGRVIDSAKVSLDAAKMINSYAEDGKLVVPEVFKDDGQKKIADK